MYQKLLAKTTEDQENLKAQLTEGLNKIQKLESQVTELNGKLGKTWGMCMAHLLSPSCPRTGPSRCKTMSSVIKCLVAVATTTTTVFAISGQVSENKMTEYVSGAVALGLATIASLFEGIRRVIDKEIRLLYGRLLCCGKGKVHPVTRTESTLEEFNRLKRLLETIDQARKAQYDLIVSQ